MSIYKTFSELSELSAGQWFLSKFECRALDSLEEAADNFRAAKQRLESAQAAKAAAQIALDNADGDVATASHLENHARKVLELTACAETAVAGSNPRQTLNRILKP